MTADDTATERRVPPSEFSERDTAKCRYARARQVTHDDSMLDWHFTLCYDHLPMPMGAMSITYEYMGDYFLPVVWDTLPANRAEQEQVSYEISHVALNGIFTTAHYTTEEDHAVYFVDAQGYDRLICVASEWGDAGEIAHAMNATFPAGDTTAYHEAERAKARAHFATFRIGREG